MTDNPMIAPDGEIPGQPRVLGTAQSGSPLDLRARELLARLSRDPDMNDEQRDAVRTAFLNGGGDGPDSTGTAGSRAR
ncbi:MAG: hypothetical protein QM630_02595 [Microbacterium sp.]